MALQIYNEGNYLKFNWDPSLWDPTTSKVSIPAAKLPSYLLGWTQKKGSSTIKCENNLVNRIVLGLHKYYTGSTKPLADMPDLKSYQHADVRQLWLQGEGFNFNPMGLGKTVEMICTLRLSQYTCGTIVAPKSTLVQWVAQIKKWWPEQADRVGYFGEGKPIVVINYEKLLKQQNVDKLRSIPAQFIVFDEGHRLKNRKARTTQNAKLLPGLSRYVLTGTPIRRQPDDLWSVLNLVHWTYSGLSYWNFVKYFCTTEQGFYGQSIVGLTEDPLKVQILQLLLSQCSVRNNVEVAVGQTLETVIVAMTASQKKLYTQVKNVVLDELPENCTIANGAVLAMRLQQVTSCPAILTGDPKDLGGKIEWLLETLDGLDEQVVVFTKFDLTAHLLYRTLADHKIAASLYTGSVADTHREVEKQQFIRGATQVFIGTIGAVGTGTDGLQCCRIGIMLDRDWSPEEVNQCISRLHRMGQQDHVAFLFLECEKSFDQHVTTVNLNKSESIRRALNDE